MDKRLNFVCDRKEMVKKMKEKVLYVFGDSLVAGHCTGVGMLDALAAKHGMTYVKYAENGATVLPCDEFSKKSSSYVPDIAVQIEQASNIVPDFICFDGLINDAYLNVIKNRLGKLDRSYSGSYDIDTFYGSFERICFLLWEKYQNSRIFYVCVHKMPTRDMTAQYVLQKAARKSCEKWSIPYVDIFRRGQLNTCVDGMRKQYSYNRADCLTDGNGTHLNAAGYEKWYLPMLESMLYVYL